MDIKKDDKTAAIRQKRRRQKLKEDGNSEVRVHLDKERTQKMQRMLEQGYASDKQAVLIKALDEASRVLHLADA